MARVSRGSGPVKLELVLVLILQLGLCASIGFTNTEAKNVWSSTQIAISPKSRVRYTRTEEVLKRCPLLTPRPPLPGDDGSTLPYGASNRLLRQRLSFRHGDWVEAQPGSTHIVPFLQWDDSKLAAKTKLASFLVTDVASTGQGGTMRKLRGIVQLAIIDGRNHPVFGIPTSGSASFTLDRGLSVLTIEVEGIYQQTENEDVVCMLGCTFLPSPDGGIHFPNIQNSLGTKALEKNCDIMIQLNYPLTFNLTSQIVRGTIQSLVPPGERYAFSPLTFSSQFRGRRYEPASEGLVDGACSAGAEPLVESQVPTYEASLEDFCGLSRVYLQRSWLDIEPNWGCNSTLQNCSTLGPFASYAPQSSYLVDYNTSRARLLVKRFTSTPCYNLEDPTFAEATPFSFVVRLVPSDESADLAKWRAGLDGHTLVAEGHWSNRSHSLCMLACRMDDASGQTDNCDSRLSLHTPLFLSITQRNAFSGSISSLRGKDHPDFFFPLSFHAKLDLRNADIPYQYTTALRYNYSRLDLAGAVLDKYEPETANPKKSAWFKYPTLIGEDGHYRSLADDLTFHRSLKSKGPAQKWTTLTFDLVAIDKYLPFLWSGFVEVPVQLVPFDVSVNDTIVTQTDIRWTHRKQEARKYLNCSGTLEFQGQDDSILSVFTEGLYNPLDGTMYMVGCRSITGRGTWQDIEESSFDLIDGMDCEIEIVLKYPTTFSAWLLKPGVTVTVHSKRPEDDVYHFQDISTETDPILYKGQRETIVSRKSIEGALSILTLSLTLVCMVGQLFYIQTHETCTPYISLSMLAAQALGYAIPLITGAESLLARKFDYRQELFLRESGSVQMVIYLDKILTLVALLLFLRLFEKVWRERKALSELGDSGSVPRERTVVIICLIIHAVGFVSVLGLHSRHSTLIQPASTVPWTPEPGLSRLPNMTLYPIEEVSTLDRLRRGALWQVSQEYTGLIEDLFLLPQAVGFSIWDVAGRPLRVSFIVGLTLLQIVPHVYDYLRSTRFGSYDAPIYADPNFDFYTHLGNILIPALALLLAVVVLCQQRWKGFLRFPRRFLYQPLRTKGGETELVTKNGRGHLPPIPEGDE